MKCRITFCYIYQRWNRNAILMIYYWIWIKLLKNFRQTFKYKSLLVYLHFNKIEINFIHHVDEQKVEDQFSSTPGPYILISVFLVWNKYYIHLLRKFIPSLHIKLCNLLQYKRNANRNIQTKIFNNLWAIVWLLLKKFFR